MEGRERRVLVLLGRVVADQVESVLPHFSPHVHPRTQVHGTAHPARGGPDQLQRQHWSHNTRPHARLFTLAGPLWRYYVTTCKNVMHTEYFHSRLRKGPVRERGSKGGRKHYVTVDLRTPTILFPLRSLCTPLPLIDLSVWPQEVAPMQGQIDGAAGAVGAGGARRRDRSFIQTQSEEGDVPGA